MIYIKRYAAAALVQQLGNWVIGRLPYDRVQPVYKAPWLWHRLAELLLNDRVIREPRLYLPKLLRIED